MTTLKMLPESVASELTLLLDLAFSLQHCIIKLLLGDQKAVQNSFIWAADESIYRMQFFVWDSHGPIPRYLNCETPF